MSELPFARCQLVVSRFVIVSLVSLMAVPVLGQPPVSPFEVELVKHLRGHESSVFSLALSADKKQMLSCGVRGKIVLWNTETWEQASELSEAGGKVINVAFSRDAKLAFAVVDPKQVLILSLPKLELLHRVDLPFRGTRLCVHPDEDWVAVSGRGGSTQLIDGANGRIENTVAGHAKETFGVRFSADGKVMYSIGDADDGKYHVRKWNVGSGQESQAIVELPSRPQRMQITPDDSWLCIATVEQAVVVDLKSEKLVHAWDRTGEKKFEDLNFWPGQDLFVSASSGGQLEFWKAGEKRPVQAVKTTKFDAYRAMPFDRETIVVCTRTMAKAIAIWKVKKAGAETTGTSASSEFRTWTSANGKFSIEASAELFAHGIVHLKRKSDGKIIQVRAESLSQADRDYLKTIKK